MEQAVAENTVEIEINIVQHTKERGQKIGQALRTVFEKTRFNQELINAHGVLCLDVGFGPEIEAFRPNEPKVLVVSEELDNLKENLAGREEVLKKLGQDLPFHIVSGYSYLGIDYVSKVLRIKVGLITLLNAFPKNLNARYLNNLIAEASQILTPGGMMLISATKDDAQSTNSQLEKVVNYQKNNGVDINILRLGSNDQLSAGQTLLVVKQK